MPLENFYRSEPQIEQPAVTEDDYREMCNYFDSLTGEEEWYSHYEMEPEFYEEEW